MSVRRVLVVEDHPPTRRRLLDDLAQGGVQAQAVTNGAEALTYLAKNKPDLVLADFIMPQLNGLELAGAMRARPDLAAIPILLLTAVDSPEVQRDCARLGVRAVVRKPVAAGDLMAAVSAVFADPSRR